jgi:hypothetical protein
MVALSLRAQTLYWDTNGNAAGTSATPSGTWSAIATTTDWSTSSAGTVATQGWTMGDAAVFSAGTNGTGSYTVTMVGSIGVSGLTVSTGNPTFSSGGTIVFASGSLSVASGSTATFNSAITGSPSSFSINGTLDLGTTESLSSTSITLDGTLDIAAGTSSFSSMTVTGNSVLDFAGGSAATFDLSSLTVNSGATLTIEGWTYGSDSFDVTSSPSTATLGRIDFSGYSDGAGWSDTYLLPDSLVPEPGTYGALFTLISFGFAFWRKRGTVLCAIG